jgi:hypothetical protein
MCKIILSKKKLMCKINSSMLTIYYFQRNENMHGQRKVKGHVRVNYKLKLNYMLISYKL